MLAHEDENEVGPGECTLDLATLDLPGQDLSLVPNLVREVARQTKGGLEAGQQGYGGIPVVRVVVRDEERDLPHRLPAARPNELLVLYYVRVLSRELGGALRGLVVGRGQKPALPLGGLRAFLRVALQGPAEPGQLRTACQPLAKPAEARQSVLALPAGGDRGQTIRELRSGVRLV